jgi:GntR family transcriptional regulator / MocR family aminotransferase
MRTSSAFEFALPPVPPGVPAYQWLYGAIRNEILEGRWQGGARLPATRDLARQYGLARGTIVNAFDQLKSEGYVEGSVGSGTYVSRVLPEQLLNLDLRTRGKSLRSEPVRITLSDYAQRASLFDGYGDRPTRAFRSNLPALDLFPIELWTRITIRCLKQMTTRMLIGCDAAGYLPLRESLADYLSRSRGVKCSANQVLVVSGVQESLDLVSRVLINSGDVVCMENPGYPGATFVFEAAGAKVRFVAMDDEGIRVEELPSAARLLYVTPGHQFPLGATMSLARRLHLLEWAKKARSLVFEDDYDSEFRFSGKPIPALHGLDVDNRVIYAGSFSKVLFPALRLGYLVVPERLLKPLEAIKSLVNRHAPILEQVVIDQFIRDGHFGRHLRRMRKVYAERLNVLLEESHKRMAGLIEMSAVEAGLQTTAWLKCGLDDRTAASAASKRHVEVTPLSLYTKGKPKHAALQLGFAALNAREIRRGVEDLAIVLETEVKRKHRAPAIE